MEILAIVPGIIAAIVTFRKSPQYAFLNVYLPVFLLLPDYYRWTVPGIPKVTFNQGAILPIAFAFLMREGHKWKFSLGDVLVFGLVAWNGLSEYVNAGYKEAQNLTFDNISWILLPYVLAKGMIEPSGLRVPFAKRYVFLLFLVAVTAVYEFKFAVVPYKPFFDRLFPWQGTGWVTTFRYGFARIAGPYGHAILAGIMLVSGFRIHRWLEWSGHWEKSFRHFPKLRLSKGMIIRLGLIAGMVMTFARGPWIGGVLAAVVTAIGRAKDRKKALLVVLGLLLFVGGPAMFYLLSYASVSRQEAKTVSQESAAYRKELMDRYVEIALEKSILGWGRNTWPKILGMPSIDNYYLLLALMHGVVAVGFLVSIILVMSVRLFLHSMRQPPPVLRGSTLGFTLLGIYLAIGFSIATVFMGDQVIPMFYLITGWSEGYLLSGRESAGSAPAAVASSKPFSFRRILK